jgi:hypothetical protein
MFADSLLDNSWADRSRCGWTTLISFAAQATAVGSMLLLPLLYTQGLPQVQLIAALVAPTPPRHLLRATRGTLAPIPATCHPTDT